MVTARRGTHNRRGKKTPPRRKKNVDTPREMTADLSVADIVSLCEGAEHVFADYGIHCAGCSVGGMESLAEACAIHGFDAEESAELLEALNALLRGAPKRPAALTITAEAARAIRKIAETEGHGGEALLVTADGRGGFCLEFRKEFAEESAFRNREEPDVEVRASALTLRRIGGATIDLRDGRFKLDLPEERCSDCEHDTCRCGKHA